MLKRHIGWTNDEHPEKNGKINCMVWNFMFWAVLSDEQMRRKKKNKTIFPTKCRAKGRNKGGTGWFAPTSVPIPLPPPKTKKNTRWWFQTFFIFIPTWRNDPIWRAYFSKVLKPPTRNSSARLTLEVWVELLDGILMPVALGFLYLLAISDVLPEPVRASRLFWGPKLRGLKMAMGFPSNGCGK